MNKENCALKLVDEIILYYDARSRKHQIVEVEAAECLVHVMSTSRAVQRNTRRVQVPNYNLSFTLSFLLLILTSVYLHVVGVQ